MKEIAFELQYFIPEIRHSQRIDLVHFYNDKRGYSIDFLQEKYPHLNMEELNPYFAHFTTGDENQADMVLSENIISEHRDMLESANAYILNWENMLKKQSTNTEIESVMPKIIYTLNSDTREMTVQCSTVVSIIIDNGYCVTVTQTTNSGDNSFTTMKAELLDSDGVNILDYVEDIVPMTHSDVENCLHNMVMTIIEDEWNYVDSML